MSTRAAGRSAVSGWLLIGLLLAAGAGIALAAAIGAAKPDVAGTLAGVTGAAWVATLPGLVAAGFTLFSQRAGLAVAAGAGIAGVARLVADLSVLAQPESVARPELFYPLSGRAYPIVAGAGAVLLLIADLLMVAAGVAAARLLAQDIRDQNELLVTGGADAADELGGAIAGGHPADPAGPDRRLDDVVMPAPVRNARMLAVGFVAVAILGFAAAQIPYAGGYIDARLSVPGTDAGSFIAPFLLAVIGVGALMVAGTLPRSVAMALLAGVAAVAAVPALVALIVGWSAAPVGVTSAPAWVLVGAVVLLLAGLLTRVRWRGQVGAAGDGDVAADAHHHADHGAIERATAAARDDAPARVRPLSVVAAVLALLAAAALIVASRVPLLLLNGQWEPLGANGFRTESSMTRAFLLAGILLVIVAAAALAGRSPIGKFGRGALIVGWAPAVWALAAPVLALGQFAGGAQQANAVAGPGSPISSADVADWTGGPGLWLGVVGAVLAIAAAVVSGIAASGEQHEDGTIVDDDGADSSRRSRWAIAGVLVVASVIALTFPVYSTTAARSTALFSLAGNDVWGVWAVLLAVVIAAVVAAVTRYGEIAVGALLAAAAAVALRTFVPAATTASPGYRASAGMVTGWILAMLLVAGGVAAFLLAKGVSSAEPQRPVASTSSRRKSPAAPQAKRAGGAA
ncbi:MAG: hypothetical protein M3Z00_00255, partial [Actinomycetota bacterium]|nr:hypothetical protein [Actinomycetota bacterium]